MLTPKPRLPRRTVLRGMGTALALPWLEAMSAPLAWARPAPREEAPVRLAYVYVPNGVHLPDWTPAAEGKGFELPYLLEPLAEQRDQLNVLSGLTSDKARANGDGPGDHARASAAFLTGVQPKKTDGQVHLGISADQIAAQAIGDRTRLRSLVLGCEGGRQSGQCDSGYACAYSHHISWQGATTPAGKETSPRQVFDRLFRGGLDAEVSAARAERQERRRSVLDFVRGDAKRLRSKLGAADRQKLEEYTTGVRELERRLEIDGNDRIDEVPDSARPKGSPADFGEHIDLLFELIALAFETDSTRIATFLVANEGSNRSYPNLGVGGGHHGISHHGGDPQKQQDIRAINRFHMERFAAFVDRMAASREGDASLLEQSLIVYGSGIADGDRHHHHDLPILLLGRGGRKLETGRHLRYPRDTPLNDLHLAMLERVGAPTATLGDSRGVLDLG